MMGELLCTVVGRWAA